MIVEKVDTDVKSITLRAENKEEQKLLDDLNHEGVNVYVAGAVLGIISLATSGEMGVYLDRDEQAALAYAVGLADYAITDTDINTVNLLQKLTNFGKGKVLFHPLYSTTPSPP